MLNTLGLKILTKVYLFYIIGLFVHLKSMFWYIWYFLTSLVFINQTPIFFVSYPTRVTTELCWFIFPFSSICFFFSLKPSETSSCQKSLNKWTFKFITTLPISPATSCLHSPSKQKINMLEVVFPSAILSFPYLPLSEPFKSSALLRGFPLCAWQLFKRSKYFHCWKN